jgi:hypothetical protein
MNPRLWTGFVNNLPIDQNYSFRQFLNEETVPGDHIMWDILSPENPMAPFVALDAESPRMDGELLQSAMADLVYIRVKRALKESDVSVVRDFSQLDPNNITARSMAQAAQANIARQAQRVNDAVEARLEWLRVNAFLGAITYSGGGGSNVQFSIQYPVRTATATTAWSDTVNSDPILDILTAYQANPMVNYTTMIAGREVFFNLMRNQKLMRQMFAGAGTAVDPTLVSENKVFSLINSELGLRAVSYNARYTTRTDSGGTDFALADGRFLPADKVIFLPAGRVGYFATRPAPQNNYQPGKFAWMDVPGQNRPMDPWLHEIGCGYYGLPVIERPFEVLVMDVTP